MSHIDFVGQHIEHEFMLKVAAFTGGENVPSARFRVRQFIPALQQAGIAVTEFRARFGVYPPAAKWLRPAWAATTLGQRLPSVLKSHAYDVVLLQREMLSTMITIEPWTKRPRVLDVDDAIWLNRNNFFAGNLARQCATVICGNQFLANYFSRWNANVVVIPTAVDTARFFPRETAFDDADFALAAATELPPTRHVAATNLPLSQTATVTDTQDLIIGWSGSFANLKYVYEIESALHQVLIKNPRARVRIISDRRPAFKLLPPEKVEFVAWSPAVEATSLQDLTIGIMPLEDSDWERGKCSYKLLLYLACGIPVVASPVGMNNEVLALSEMGLAARNADEWEMALTHLLSAPDKRATLGSNGRRTIVEHFSVHNTVHKIAQELRNAAA